MIIEKHYPWSEFLKQVDWADEDFMQSSDRASQKNGDKGWYGTQNFKEALDLARYGWTEKLSEIRQLELKEIPSFQHMYKTETEYGLAGGSVDIGRFLTGMPDCMQRQIINSGFNIPAGFARVVINNGCLANISFDQKFEYGRKAIAVINTLELSNIRTEVDLMVQVDREYSVFIKLKNSEDSFYLEKIMFPISHIAFHRRLCFSERERNTPEVRNYFGFKNGGGYGSTSDKFNDSDPDTLYFNGIHFDQNKINETLERILASRQKFM